MNPQTILAATWFMLALTLGACAVPAREGGVVAADHPLASEAGAHVLRRGGNAVDAAVAASLALSVVRPDACGIGGGGFMLIHLEDHPVHGAVDTALNYREVCPEGIGPGSFRAWGDGEASRFGGRAVAVPGTVAGLMRAHERYGVLPRAEVVGPAIRLAERGHRADAHHVRAASELMARFEQDAAWRERFAFVWERFLLEGRVREGDLIRSPEQARALRLIARDGAEAFSRGPIAEAIVETVGRDGGVLTMADLAGFGVQEVEPLRVPWRGKTLLVMPPPSSGGIAIGQVFGLADRLELELPASGWPDAETAHLLAESLRAAFADRARHLADPAFHKVPIGAMLDPATLDAAAARIRDGRRDGAETDGIAPLPEDGGTSHISVVDGHGNAVACTETINLAFGSLLAVDGFGFCLNNEMDDFTTVPGEPNAFGLSQAEANLPEPGKRPLSSMSPTIVLDADGAVLAVAGGSGGPRIISATAQVLLRMLTGDATAAEAVGAPRLHHQWSPDLLTLETWPEPGAADALAAGLRAHGHRLAERRDIGAVQAIRRAPGGGWEAASDPRKGGSPAFE